MKEVFIRRRTLKALYSRFRYALDRSHRNHRSLRSIVGWFRDCTSIYHLVTLAIEASGWPENEEGVRFIEYMGGSTYGADLDDEEVTQWLEGFAERMLLRCVFLAAHRRSTGRFDFHILTPAFDGEGRLLFSAELRAKAMAVARELTQELNIRRLAQGRLVIGNLTAEGSVFFLRALDVGQEKAPVSAVAADDTQEDTQPCAAETAVIPEKETEAPALSDEEAEIVATAPAVLPGEDKNEPSFPLSPQVGEEGTRETAPEASAPDLVQEPWRAQGSSSQQPAAKPTESAIKPAAPAVEIAPLVAVDDEAERKAKAEKAAEKKAAENERMEAERQVRVLRRLNELRLWLDSLPSAGDLPLKGWSRYAVRLGVCDEKVAKSCSVELFLEKHLPPCLDQVGQHVRTDRGRQLLEACQAQRELALKFIKRAKAGWRSQDDSERDRPRPKGPDRD